ncbi:MAG TPA: glycosyltransferase family 1 protein [Deltaproteobacteria bacterium]|nr:glycosyltransferase family 1 protein [Deltaproteobacteria bacterium]
MKILMFGWEFPPSVSGGLGTACRGLADGLLANGAEVVFVAPGAEASAFPPDLRIIDGLSAPLAEDSEATPAILERPVDVLLAPYMTAGDYREQLPERDGDRYGGDMYDEVARYARCARAVARTEYFDVIAVHDWMTIPAGMAAREETGRPLIVHIHSLESDRSPLRINEYIYGVERFGMLEADQVIAVSNYTKQKIIDQYGIPGGRITVVHNAALPLPPAPRKNVKEPAGGKTVLFLGRITFQKGPGYFIESALLVAAADPSVRFLIVGAGDMISMMKQRAVEEGIADRCVFTGFLEGGDVTESFARSDLYVMPSDSEPFGITALEAISQGVPVILSVHSGVAEVLQSCPVVDPEDTEELAREMLDILGDDDRRRKIVRDGLEDMRELTWRRQAAAVLACYRSAADRAGETSLPRDGG